MTIDGLYGSFDSAQASERFAFGEGVTPAHLVRLVAGQHLVIEDAVWPTMHARFTAGGIGHQVRATVMRSRYGFHGTHRALQPGDVITPSTMLDGLRTGETDRLRQEVYMWTVSAPEALDWARRWAVHAWECAGRRGRPAVYLVRANGQMAPDPQPIAEMGATTAETADVLELVWLGPV